MMRIKTITLMLLLVAISACSDDASMTSEMKQETAVEHAEKHMDDKYVCPMHSEIVSNEPGSCPLCGMTMVKVEANDAADNSTKEKKVLYWVAPMDPSFRKDKPGKSLMGMDLIPVYDDGDSAGVKISPAVENNMGVRTAVVERDKLWKRINTVGYINFDESKISHVTLRTQGWVERLHVKSEGERVKKGQLLFELYSPELVNAQEEYVQALRTSSKRLARASKERLVALGISYTQITELGKTRKVSQYVRIYAKQNGIVAKLNIRQGMFVKPAKEVMSLADLSTVWILAEVFETQANWVAEGQQADVTLSYLPGHRWQGKVEYIYPSLNPKTRTLKVRLVFENHSESLKPNMFANVKIYADGTKDTLVVPREAVIRSGEHDRVILAMGKGRFQPRKVLLGIESGDFMEIKSGLQVGDKVVTSGQFLLDSEASLKASINRMTNTGTSDAADTMMMDENKPTEASMKTPSAITGIGTIKDIVLEDGKVNINHQPIDTIGWSAMTMYFKVQDDVQLRDFNVDDKIEFDLKKSGSAYEITSIRKINPDMR